MTKTFNSSSISRYSIWWRRLIHRPLAALVRLTLPCKVRLFRSDFVPNGKPTIFAATHVFYDDIAAVLSCLKQSSYLLLGVDVAESAPTGVDKFALGLNGVITVDRSDKQSRTESFDKIVKVLERHGDILMFPEASWNLSPNTITAKLHWGVVRIATHINANIVPIAVNIVNNEYYVIIGKRFKYDNYSTHHESVDALRDEMATLAWELIKLSLPAKRKTITDEYWLKHIRETYAKLPLASHDKEESFMYRPKGEISLGEVLAEMHGTEYKSMAADYEQYRRIEQLIDDWTTPIRLNYINQNDRRNI